MYVGQCMNVMHVCCTKYPRQIIVWSPPDVIIKITFAKLKWSGFRWLDRLQSFSFLAFQTLDKIV